MPAAAPDGSPDRRLAWTEVPGAALAAERCGAALPATPIPKYWYILLQ